MIGLNRHNGRAVSGDDHLVQSGQDVLTTPKGTRVMRRAYGSDLPAIIDQPVNGETFVDLVQATAEALDEWEPRLELERITLEAAQPGRVEIVLIGTVDHGAIELPITVGAAP